MTYAPILLFVYNRPDHTRRTVEALLKNTLAKESDLIILSDGPKNELVNAEVEAVRSYISSIKGFKSVAITERDSNVGLAQSIITGVTQTVTSHGKVIVVEDDLVSSPHFLEYMNDALTLYENDEDVISIHGYVYPTKTALPETFFLRGADCWSWATWKRGWDLFEPDGAKLLSQLEQQNLVKTFDFDGSYNYTGMLRRQIAGQNNSWAIRWYASAFLKNKLTLYPGKSLIYNIGQDSSGTHAAPTPLHGNLLYEGAITVRKIPQKEDVVARAAIKDYFKSLKPSLVQRIFGKIIPRQS